MEDLPVFLRKGIGLTSLSNVRVDQLKGCENLELLHGSIQLGDAGPHKLEAMGERIILLAHERRRVLCASAIKGCARQPPSPMPLPLMASIRTLSSKEIEMRVYCAVALLVMTSLMIPMVEMQFDSKTPRPPS